MPRNRPYVEVGQALLDHEVQVTSENGEPIEDGVLFRGRDHVEIAERAVSGEEEGLEAGHLSRLQEREAGAEASGLLQNTYPLLNLVRAPTEVRRHDDQRHQRERDEPERPQATCRRPRGGLPRPLLLSWAHVTRLLPDPLKRGPAQRRGPDRHRPGPAKHMLASLPVRRCYSLRMRAKLIASSSASSGSIVAEPVSNPFISRTNVVRSTACCGVRMPGASSGMFARMKEYKSPTERRLHLSWNVASPNSAAVWHSVHVERN